MRFSIWLEKEERDYDFFKNLILGKLELSNEALSQSIGIYEPDDLISKLQSLGEYAKLPEEIKSQVEGQIRSGTGTLGDLVRLMIV